MNNPEISKSNEFIKQFPPVRDKIIQKLKKIFPAWQENDLAQLNQETRLELSLLLPILHKADQMYISGLPETTVKIPEKKEKYLEQGLKSYDALLTILELYKEAAREKTE